MLISDWSSDVCSSDLLLQRTMQFNPTRSESSLRRGILHNAVQLDDGSWVWRHSRWRLSGDATIGEAEAAMGEPGEGLYDEPQATLAGIDVPDLLARGMRPASLLSADDAAALLEVEPTSEERWAWKKRGRTGISWGA